MEQFWRLQDKKYPLTRDSVSWPWGMARQDAEAEGLLLNGVSACYSAAALVKYFETRGGASDELADVVVFEGEEIDNAPDEITVVAEAIAAPRRIIAHGTYSSLAALILPHKDELYEKSPDGRWWIDVLEEEWLQQNMCGEEL